MATKFDSRQTEHRSTLDQLSNETKPTLKQTLPSIDSELTPSFVLRPSSPADLTISVGTSKVTNSETGKNRTNIQSPDFASGTIVFPAASGGSAVVTPGANKVLTVSVGNYIKGLIGITKAGQINIVFGVEGASEALATLPLSADGDLPAGYVTLQNSGGVHIDQPRCVLSSKIQRSGQGKTVAPVRRICRVSQLRGRQGKGRQPNQDRGFTRHDRPPVGRAKVVLCLLCHGVRPVDPPHGWVERCGRKTEQYQGIL